MHFSILRASGGGFFFRIVGGNNETMSHSEVYVSVAGAQHAIAVIKGGAASANVVDLT